MNLSIVHAQEEWRPIPTRPGFEASDRQRIREVFADGTTRLINVTSTTVGYKLANLRHHRTQGVHRLIALAFYGEPPAGMQCRHLNGDPTDNRVENLAWGTPKQNTADAIAQGRHISIRSRLAAEARRAAKAEASA